MEYTGLIARYCHRLPIDKNSKLISLGEGSTPLVRLENIPKTLDKEIDIYVKYEGLNPTGSFKDRGMTVAVTKAVAQGEKAVICASTGNTSASAAAYATRAGILAFVIIPKGKIAMGKLAQAIMHGAIILQINGNFDQGMHLVKAIGDDTPITIVNSINPYRLQGQKTAAFEIVEALNNAPDYHYLPVGNAGNICAYWMGYKEYYRDGLSAQLPVMVGYQAAGAAPFVRGKMVDNPQTIATAIRIGHPQSYDLALKAQTESNGWFAACADDDILAAQKLLANKEGIFCEPASAISLAGVIADLRQNKIKAGSKIVCTLTGHGLKDPDIAITQAKGNIINIKPEPNQVRDAILSYI